jgi:hypothetical protein
VTLVAHSGGRLLTMNRDEQAARPEDGPRLWQGAPNPYVAPTDLQAGGTWIAANAHGLVCCLVNRYDKPGPGPLSRGAIAPAAMAGRDGREAIDAIAALDHARYAPFTSVVLSRTGDFRADWDGTDFNAAPIAEAAPWMITSATASEYREKRQALFQGLIGSASGADLDEAVSAFHTRRDEATDMWAPMMRRERGQTKSVTQILIDSAHVEMRYWPRESAIARGLHDPDVVLAVA